MKKLLIAIVIIIAISFAVAPNFIGQRAETEFKQLYSQIESTGDFTISVTEYQRGWFSSTAVVQLELNMARFDPTTTESLVFKMHNDISHGPVLRDTREMELGLLDIDSSVEFPEALLQEMPDFNESFNDLVTIKNRMYFDGTMFGLFELQEFKFSDPDVNLTISPAKFEATTSTAGNILTTGFWDGMSVSDNGTFGITMGKMGFDFDLTSISGNIYDPMAIYSGTTAMTIAEVRVTGQELPGMVKLENITLGSLSVAENDVMNINIDMGIAAIDAVGLNFTDFVLNQSFDSMHTASIQQMNAMFNNDAVMQNIEQHMDELTQITMTMLANNPVYKIRELGVMTAQGAISSEMTASLDETLVDVTNPESIALAAIVDASGYVPVAFLTSMGVMPMVQPFVDQGYITSDGENLNFEFSFKQGQMTLSGKPFPMAPTQ